MSDQSCDCCGGEALRHDEQTAAGATTDGRPAAIDEEPATELDRPIPDELGALTATAYDTDSKPETLGDLVDGLRSWARSQDVWPPSFEDLCHADDTRHVLELDGETHHFACVIDPLMVPGMLDRDGLVVRSASPMEGAEVEIRIEDGKFEVTPSTAVLSLGASRSIERLDGDEFAPDEAYAQVCAYGNAFPNRTTYDAWAKATPEAATMAMPMTEGIELARALVA